MPAAPRTLMDVLMQERCDFGMVRWIFLDVVQVHVWIKSPPGRTFHTTCDLIQSGPSKPLNKALGHLHEKGFVHCDLKPLNAVRGADGTFRLIDLDSAVEIGQPIGAKVGAYDGSFQETNEFSPDPCPFCNPTEPKSDPILRRCRPLAWDLN